MAEIDPSYAIRPFRPDDQHAARSLILAGLAERWGELDSDLNHDLDDIWAHYVAAGGLFVVSECGGAIVGTGALSLVAPEVGRIERVSVQAAFRRQGLGRAISQHLLNAARRLGFRQVLVETTATWDDAIRLYRQCGFTPVAYRDGDVHMELDL